MIDFDNFIFNNEQKDIIKTHLENNNIKLFFIGESETGKTTLI